MLSVTSATAIPFHPCLIAQANNLTAEQLAPYRGPYKSRMQEWSYLRATPKTPDKFRAHDLNTVHKRFVDFEMDLSDYVLKLLEYLSRYYAEADAAEFLTTHAVGIETGTFRPTHGKFAKFLDAQWDSWCDRHGVARLAPEEDVLPIAVEARTAPPIAATAANIEKAYWEYLAGVDGAQDRLYSLVLRFATQRARFLLSDAPAIHNLADDAAQNAIVDVMGTISKFRGETGQFYNWLRHICSNHGVDSFKANIATGKERVPMQVPDTFGNMEDNPLLNREQTVQYRRKLPDFIKGADRLICGYIRQGLDYKQISRTMDLTVDGVKQRLARMKKHNLNA